MCRKFKKNFFSPKPRPWAACPLFINIFSYNGASNPHTDINSRAVGMAVARSHGLEIERSEDFSLSHFFDKIR